MRSVGPLVRGSVQSGVQLLLNYAKLNGFWTARLKARVSKLSDAVETPVTPFHGLTGGLNGFIRDSNPLCVGTYRRLTCACAALVRRASSAACSFASFAAASVDDLAAVAATAFCLAKALSNCLTLTAATSFAAARALVDSAALLAPAP